MKYLFALALLLVSFSAVAQTGNRGVKGYVQGTVYDEEGVIPYASVRILTRPDSTYIQGEATNEKGRFSISVSPGKYILEVAFMGYKTVHENFETTLKQPGHQFEKIRLLENSILLGEAIIEAKIPDIVVKGDTIEYNATSYSSEESDMLQDMMKNIPGIEVDANGNITANGKPVRKILVDGKEFFGNDIPMALANLPANMIKKLQLYKEESETAKITGFKDKDPEQVLNLVVKEELKQSVFGDVKAGFGSNDKYAHKATGNYMRNNNQVSFIADMNNTNDNSYGMADNGIEKNKNIGANAYLQPSEKMKIGGSVRYSNDENIRETQTNSQTFISTGDRFAKQNARSHDNRENRNLRAHMEWTPDSLTTIFARTSIALNNNKNNQTSSNISYVAQKDTTSGQTINQTKGESYSIANNLTIGRKLNDKGRTLSLSLNNSLRKDDSKGANYSETVHSGANPNRIIDQRSVTDSKMNSYGFSASYVEPLGKDHRLQLSYSYSKNISDRFRDVRKKDGAGDYSIIDSAYTRNTENRYTNQNISLNFQTTKEKYNYTIGFGIDPSSSRSKISLGDSIIEDVKQSEINFSPNLNFAYTPNDNTTFDFNYSGSTAQPSISQLSADTTILSAMSKHHGNPNLKPSYSNNVNLYYQKSNYETKRFLMISVGFNYTFNQIANYSTIDTVGNTINTYRNVDGNMGANLNMMYDTPLRNDKFTINNSLYTNYYRSIGFTNSEKAISDNVVLGGKITGKFKIPKFETSLRLGANYNMVRNNLSSSPDGNTSTYTLKYTALVKLPFDISVQNNFEGTYYAGYGDDFKKSEMLWNASITKLFLKKKKGSLRLQFFDILNDRNNISRNVSGDGISDSRSNTISRYFMMSFSYKFNVIMKGNKNKKSSDTDYGDEYM